MTVHVDAWQVLVAVFGLIGAMATAAWTFGRVIVGQFASGLDQRFNALNQSRAESNAHLETRIDELRDGFKTEHDDLERNWNRRFITVEELSARNERDLLKMRADLPTDYVRREDWIRFSGTIDSKLDHLRTMIEGVREKINARG